MASDWQDGPSLQPPHPACCTGSFIRKGPKRRVIKYEAGIPWWHYQLRHLCALNRPGSLYFIQDLYHVYHLDTVARAHHYICKLPFKASCLAAKDDWICVGCADERAEGRFIVIKASESGYGEGVSIDDRSIQPQMRAEGRGLDVINSISIWKPEGAVGDEETVAVLTNNDKTVRVYHLLQRQFLITLNIGVATNHASISPDGTRLIAVTDVIDDPAVPTLYFFRSIEQDDGDESALLPPRYLTSRGGQSHAHRWVKDGEAWRVPGDSLFSSSFSRSGEYCAVANQGLSVSIYKMPGGDGSPEELVRIPSSQSHRARGAVRSLMFAPRPWDLLIWAEGTSRFGIADQRTGFRTHPIIDVEELDEEAHKIPIGHDLSDEDAMDTNESLFIRQAPLSSGGGRATLPRMELMNDPLQSLPSLSRQFNAVELDQRQTRERMMEQIRSGQTYSQPISARRRAPSRLSQEARAVRTQQPARDNQHSPMDQATRNTNPNTSSTISIPHLPTLRQRASDNFRSQILGSDAPSAGPTTPHSSSSIYRSARAAVESLGRSEPAYRPPGMTDAQLAALGYDVPTSRSPDRTEELLDDRANADGNEFARQRAIRNLAASGLVSAGTRTIAVPRAPRSIPSVGMFPASGTTDSGDGEDEVVTADDDESGDDQFFRTNPSGPSSGAPTDIESYLRLREQVMNDAAIAASSQVSNQRSRQDGEPSSPAGTRGWPRRRALQAQQAWQPSFNPADGTQPPSRSPDPSERALPWIRDPPARRIELIREQNREQNRERERRRREVFVSVNPTNGRDRNPILSMDMSSTLRNLYERNPGRRMQEERNIAHNGQEPLSDFDLVGLCMEEDGSYLYVTTVSGIYQIPMDIESRMFYPAKVMTR